jgi:hypothetical protein
LRLGLGRVCLRLQHQLNTLLSLAVAVVAMTREAAVVLVALERLQDLLLLLALPLQSPLVLEGQVLHPVVAFREVTEIILYLVLLLQQAAGVARHKVQSH